ncbi:MAG: clostripain-related cysteine peptidase [Pirellulaceae bacterium]
MIWTRNHLMIGLTAVLVIPALTTRPGNAQEDNSGDQTPWTVLIYGGVDSSSEEHIMPHLQSLELLSSEGQRGEVLLLIDRTPGHSEDYKLLGENFEDTRLFQLKNGNWHRVSGGAAFPEIDLESKFEANSGDAQTLRKFIAFGKTFAPAEKYALIVFGHGDCRSVCPDVSSPDEEHDEFDDPLYVAEMTEVLGESESVDLIWFDVCSFGSIENAYQLRPGTGQFSTAAMLATPPASSPAPMGEILEEAGILGRSMADKDVPADGVSFGRVAVELMQQRLEQAGLGSFRESWGCYDLSTAEAVKQSVDQLAVALAEGNSKDIAERIRGEDRRPLVMNYMHRGKGSPRMWVVSPHFDLYDLASRFSRSEECTEAVRSRARDVMTTVDRFVVASLGGRSYRDFEPGKNGVFIVFPDGDALWRDQPQWATFDWYNPDDRGSIRYAFGKYAWCADGAIRGNGAVENWFELMDSWFDANDTHGGVNNYRW